MDLTNKPAARDAFTLIELLVVITIIAILMGLLFPAFKGVQDQAKRTQAKNDVTQIVTAVNAFYTEYGKYPVRRHQIGGNDFICDPATTMNNKLFDILQRRFEQLERRRPTIRKRLSFSSPTIAKGSKQAEIGIGSEWQ